MRLATRNPKSIYIEVVRGLVFALQLFFLLCKRSQGRWMGGRQRLVGGHNFVPVWPVRVVVGIFYFASASAVQKVW